MFSLVMAAVISGVFSGQHSGIDTLTADRFGRLHSVLFCSQSQSQLTGIKVRTAFRDQQFLQTGAPDEAAFVISRVRIPYQLDAGQVYNHIAGEGSLSEKDRLLVALRRYRQQAQQWAGRPLPFDPFMPRTYRTGIPWECAQLCRDVEEGGAPTSAAQRSVVEWIRKPGGPFGHNAQGIDVLTRGQMESIVRHNRSGLCLPRSPFLVQRYVPRPLLLDGRRVDLRVFMVVASVRPALVLWHWGYGRIAMHQWSETSTADARDEAQQHLTNRGRSGRAGHGSKGGGSVVSEARPLRHYASQRELSQTLDRAGARWTDRLVPRIRHAVEASFLATRGDLDPAPGYFGVYGGDFVYSTQTDQLYLLEWNAGPQYDNIQAENDGDWAVDLWRGVIDVMQFMRQHQQTPTDGSNRYGAARPRSHGYNESAVCQGLREPTDPSSHNQYYTYGEDEATFSTLSVVINEFCEPIIKDK